MDTIDKKDEMKQETANSQENMNKADTAARDASDTTAKKDAK